MRTLPFRQVHLDFHTSPAIPDVAEEFSPEEFAGTLAESHVNSVTVFAKCHHGMSYYETRIGRKHPALKRDLLGDMIEACHRKGIRTPVYYSVTWDEYLAESHPEWRWRDVEGRPSRPPLEPGWRSLCLNTPYAEVVAEATREIVGAYAADGMFYDIWFLNPCYCARCLAAMKREGLDPRRHEDHLALRTRVNQRLMERLTRIVREARPKATLYYNSLPTFSWGSYADYMSHLEIECLPRGGWGYDFFPLCVRRAQGFDKPLLGMTGRFLENWGHFGSLSPRASLEYECFSALSHGAACSIGDQLHPRGRLDRDVYELIGHVFAQVRAKEPWCVDSRPLAELAVLSCNDRGVHPGGFPEGDLGAMKMLTQCHYQFDVIDRTCSFESYPLLVVPDELPCDADLAGRLERYLASGGKLLASHRACLVPDGSGFALDAIPASLQGEAPHSPDYLVLKGDWAAGLPAMPLVAYERALRVEAKPDAEVLATVADPYFDRTWEQFCSHFHTPANEETPRPAIAAAASVVYLAHPIFASYHRHGFVAYREIVTRCIDRLLGRRMVESNLPHSARVTLAKQEERTILHILHYIPERRTPRFEIVEDVIPLVDTRVSIPSQPRPSRVYLAPQGEELECAWENGRAEFVVPRIEGHQMIVIE